MASAEWEDGWKIIFLLCFVFSSLTLQMLIVAWKINLFSLTLPPLLPRCCLHNAQLYCLFVIKCRPITVKWRMAYSRLLHEMITVMFTKKCEFILTFPFNYVAASTEKVSLMEYFLLCSLHNRHRNFHPTLTLTFIAAILIIIMITTTISAISSSDTTIDSIKIKIDVFRIQAWGEGVWCLTVESEARKLA